MPACLATALGTRQYPVSSPLVGLVLFAIASGLLAAGLLLLALLGRRLMRMTRLSLSRMYRRLGGPGKLFTASALFVCCLSAGGRSRLAAIVGASGGSSRG